MAIHPQKSQRFSRSSPSSLRLVTQEIQEVSMQLQSAASPPSHLVTLHRPAPQSMTELELSFHQQSYSSHRSLPTLQPLVEASEKTTQRMNKINLQLLPHKPRLPHQKTLSHPFTPLPLPVNSKRAKPLSLSVVRSSKSPVAPQSFQEFPNSMLVRKPEPISWIKYPLEAHNTYSVHPGPYAAVDLPFHDNSNSDPIPKSYKKGKIYSTWGPQKLKCLEKSRKSVRFASTWGPAHPARLGEYATINPRKLSSKYVRPAVFTRPNLKD